MKLFYKVKKVLLRYLLPLFFRWIPIKDIYLFSSYYGQYADSPRLIAEELHNVIPDTRFYWVVKSKKQKDALPSYIQPVGFNTIQSIYLLWTAKFLVDNCQKQLAYRLRREQVYLQTWHGTPLKKIEFDVPDKLSKHYLNYSRHDHASITDLLIGNEYSEKIYQTAFKVSKTKYRRIGIPRNDVFSQLSVKTVSDIKQKLGIKKEIKIVMYAPTFRQKAASNGIPQLERLQPFKLLEILNHKSNQQWILLVRFHPNVIHQELRSFTNDPRIFNVTQEFEMSDLLEITDLLITDYSSSFFDFALTKKPIALFPYDYNEYMMERGTYLQLEDIPLLVAKTSSQLLNELKNESWSSLQQRTYELCQQLGSYDQGDATKKAVQLLVNYR